MVTFHAPMVSSNMLDNFDPETEKSFFQALNAEGPYDFVNPEGFGLKTMKGGRAEGIPVGMCGEAAASPTMIPLLISFGLTEFSVSAPSVLKVRKNISKWTKAEADAVAEQVMAMTTEAEIKEYLESIV